MNTKSNFAVTGTHPGFQYGNSELNFSILFPSVATTLGREGKLLRDTSKSAISFLSYLLQ